MREEEIRQYCFSSGHGAFFESFVRYMPAGLIPYLHIKKYESYENLIYSNERSKVIFFLMKGTLYALEERIRSQSLIFTELHPVEIIGDFELFADMSDSYASVIAAGPCECLTIPSNIYYKWISGNSSALFYRIKKLIMLLGDQSAAQRQFFFMDYQTRCALILLQISLADKTGEMKLQITREQLSDRVGCSLRTCKRIISSFEREGLISIEHGKIKIDARQKMRLIERVQRCSSDCRVFGLGENRGV